MMGGRETWSTAMPSPHQRQSNTSSSSSSASTSSSLRFMGIPKQPEPDMFLPPAQTQHSDPFELELDESDVVWSSSDFASRSLPPNLSTTTSSSHLHQQQQQQQQSRFSPSKSGLSAALADDQHPLIRRKSTLNPSVSATSAARTIPPVNSGSRTNGGVKFHQSAPVNVPAWPNKIGKFNNNENKMHKFEEVEDELEDEEEMVPPHVIVARSHVTFSVFEGVGRTLKGRDLRRVRNAVFQQTGYNQWPQGTCIDTARPTPFEFVSFFFLLFFSSSSLFLNIPFSSLSLFFLFL